MPQAENLTKKLAEMLPRLSPNETTELLHLCELLIDPGYSDRASEICKNSREPIREIQELWSEMQGTKQPVDLGFVASQFEGAQSVIHSAFELTGQGLASDKEIFRSLMGASSLLNTGIDSIEGTPEWGNPECAKVQLKAINLQSLISLLIGVANSPVELEPKYLDACALIGLAYEDASNLVLAAEQLNITTAEAKH